jgi:hypothetical protein
MARIVEGLQLIAVKTILAIRRDVEHHTPRRDQNHRTRV